MADQNVQEMSLVLSTDAKPRLKWTPDLHQGFVLALNRLGGPQKATPKNLMRMMGIQGLTLYHLKSHLQKYRHGKNLETKVCKDLKEENVDCDETCNSKEINLVFEEDQVNDTSITTENQIQENSHIDIANAIQLQMDVQRKIHEQIEVQRHLQLRIEAQGKYLEKVLQKAHEALSSYNCPNSKVNLSQLFSMVSNSSTFSELTEVSNRAMWAPGCSVDCSLSSSESSKRHQDKERDTAKYECKKRGKSEICDSILVKRSRKNSKEDCKDDDSGNGLTKFDFLKMFDKNSERKNDLKLGIKEPIIDLNLKV